MIPVAREGHRGARKIFEWILLKYIDFMLLGQNMHIEWTNCRDTHIETYVAPFAGNDADEMRLDT